MKNHIKIVPYILALLFLLISLMTVSLMTYYKTGAPKPLSERPLLSEPVKPSFPELVKPSFPEPVKPPFPDFVVPGPR